MSNGKLSDILGRTNCSSSQAVIVAEEWGVCGAGLTCARSEQLLLRYRGVWCADVVAWTADRPQLYQLPGLAPERV